MVILWGDAQASQLDITKYKDVKEDVDGTSSSSSPSFDYSSDYAAADTTYADEYACDTVAADSAY